MPRGIEALERTRSMGCRAELLCEFQEGSTTHKLISSLGVGIVAFLK